MHEPQVTNSHGYQRSFAGTQPKKASMNIAAGRPIPAPPTKLVMGFDSPYLLQPETPITYSNQKRRDQRPVAHAQLLGPPPVSLSHRNRKRYCSNARTISGSSFVTPLAVQVSIVESV
jgi:hypothetical protein